MYRQSNGLLTSALSQPAYEAMVPNYDACLQKSSCPEHFEKLAYMVTPLGKCCMCNGSAFSDATTSMYFAKTESPIQCPPNFTDVADPACGDDTCLQH